MSDDLKQIHDKIETDINPAGAPGSVLAQNHKDIEQSMVKKLGKYSGFTYNAIANAVPTLGNFSWQNKPMNTLTDFTVKFNKLNSDGLDMTILFSIMRVDDLIKFKDYLGRTALLVFKSYSSAVESGEDVINVVVVGLPTNPSYAYNGTDSYDSVFDFITKGATKGSEILNDVPFLVAADIPALSSNFVALTDTPVNYTGQANKKVVVNATEDALEFTDDVIDNVAPTIKGMLYNKDTWVDTSDFTTFGNATAVMSGSKINIGSTTNGSYENYITLGNTTGLNKWKSTIEIKVINAPAATTYGLGLGLRSQHLIPSNRIHFVSTIGLATASNNIYMIQGVGYNIIGTSATSFSFSQNDIIRLTVEQDLDVITSTFFNITTGQVLVESYTYTLPLSPFPCNTADFAIHMLGGTYEMQSMKLESKEWEKSKVMFIGDSKTNGFQGDSFLGSFPQQFNTLIGGVADNSGGKDTTEEVLLKIPEIINLAPKKVVLNIGSNDKRFGKTFIQWQVNYDSIVAQLEAVGITVYHLLQLNEASGLSFTDYNNHITTTYNSDNIIDAGVVPLYTDNVHPNQQAMDQIFMAVVSKIGGLV